MLASCARTAPMAMSPPKPFRVMRIPLQRFSALTLLRLIVSQRHTHHLINPPPRHICIFRVRKALADL